MIISVYKKLFIPLFFSSYFSIIVVSFLKHRVVFSNEKYLSIFIIISAIICYIISYWLAKRFTLKIRKTEQAIKDVVADVVANEDFYRCIKTNSGDEISSICHSVNALLSKLHKIHRKQLDIEKQKTKLAQFSAFVKTTQMLAHDVRKPFSMLQGILSLLESCHDPDEIVRLSKDAVRDVQRALAAVDGMIEDILEVGREAETEKKPICPESLLKTSLAEVCRVYQKASVKLHYEWNHRYMINADAIKLQRVFSNIFANAIQAMNNQGSLWIKTWENPSENMTLFCIGNSGSSIAQEELPQVFDAFYTKNKAGGTGLGLAIAKKIILAHGGRIWCESSEKKKSVEFYFTLPTVAGIVNKHTVRLVNNTQKAIAAVGKNRTPQPHTGEHPRPL